MVSPHMCGLGSLFCSPVAHRGMERSSERFLHDITNHEILSDTAKEMGIRKSSSCNVDISRSNSSLTDKSGISLLNSCSSTSLGERVLVARPGLVVVRDVALISGVACHGRGGWYIGKYGAATLETLMDYVSSVCWVVSKVVDGVGIITRVATSIAQSFSINSVPTANPSVMLFYPATPLHMITEDMVFNSSNTSRCQSPLACKLLQLQGVHEVILTSDHISVKKVHHKHKNKSNETRCCTISWTELKPMILAALLEFFSSGVPVLIEEDIARSECSTDISLMIQDLIDSQIRPLVQREGGDVLFVDYNHHNHCVEMSYQGNCKSSPTATHVLEGVILKFLQFYIPEIKEIVQVSFQR